MINDLELYHILCRKADEILIKNGTRDLCVKCSVVKPINPERKELGCCTGCKYLGESGCTTQSLACKLWLCYSIIRLKKFSEKELEIFARIKRIAYKKNFYWERGNPFVTSIV